MRFNTKAFTASLPAVSAEESRANMADLVATQGRGDRHLSIEHEVREDLDALASKTLMRDQKRFRSA